MTKTLVAGLCLLPASVVVLWLSLSLLVRRYRRRSR